MVIATEALERFEAKQKGTPDEFIGRRYLKANEVSGCFENDDYPIVIEKPKMKKDKDSKKYVRVTSNDGQFLLFEKVLWLPILYNGEKCVVCTTQKQSIAFVETAIKDVKKSLEKGTEEDDNRVTKFVHQDVFEGHLIFNKVKVEYADGQRYDNYILTACTE